MNSIKRLESSTRVLDKILEVSSLSLLIISTILALFNIAMRFFFDTTYSLVEELCRYTIIYGTFMYLGPLIKKDEHIKMDFLNSVLKGRLLQINSLLINIILLASCAVLFWTGTQWVISLFQLGIKTTSGTMLLALPSLAVPIGMFFACVYSILLIIIDYRKIRDNYDESLAPKEIKELDI
ncbi:TRAP-type C4-dicarboxylate transport system permease small subunit [Bacillus niacini]|uniref:TRAP-type C4-dicarboxylate transport system permease small subunit n=1 Tax=Neobacillus niacini TaxID=86668 RepID=A0A852T6K2_9BACI|nr:TRAP transporter small permease subunit [Neobacillus niacini]NYE04273.1 TRAP-type C4-dicarboxylate transport system permease small subunit [Neobacillus niacini]